MSNRTLKIRLHKENPRCYYCGTVTILTNIARGKLPSNAATIEHLVSRYHVGRWVKRKKNQKRRVLSCWKCNHERSAQETLCLSRKEILDRSKGFSFSPRGKPTINKPLTSVKEVKKELDKNTAKWNGEA